MLVPQVLAVSFICLFFAICFIQSGLDKISDRAGNLDWLTGHFAQTPFKSLVPGLLSAITLLELAAGIMSLIAAFAYFLNKLPLTPTIALSLCCGALLCLFTGQRIAKDYVGAATLAAYFVIAALGLALVPT